MGASLSLAIRKKFPWISVWGYARKKSSFDKLRRLRVVNNVSRSLGAVIKESDIVVLATPVFTIIEYFKKIRPFLKKGAIVIDLGSTKSSVERGAKRSLPAYAHFVGTHPLCGSHPSALAVGGRRQWMAKPEESPVYQNP